MDADASARSGLLGSLRGFVDGVVGSVQDRVELVAVELQEEKHRLIQIAIWISAIAVLAMLGLIFASVALLVIFWDTARIPVAVGLAVVYLGGLGIVIARFRHYLGMQPKPFAATLGEFREDRACIRDES